MEWWSNGVVAWETLKLSSYICVKSENPRICVLTPLFHITLPLISLGQKEEKRKMTQCKVLKLYG